MDATTTDKPAQRTESPQLSQASPGGPPKPATEAQRATAIDRAGQARPDLTAQPDTAARSARSATFAAPAPAASRNGPIWRYAPDHGQGGTIELGMLDGLLAVTINPDNGKPVSIRLPAAAGLDLQAKLAGVDLR